jgi:hypothetical protein
MSLAAVAEGQQTAELVVELGGMGILRPWE